MVRIDVPAMKRLSQPFSAVRIRAYLAAYDTSSQSPTQLGCVFQGGHELTVSASEGIRTHTRFYSPGGLSPLRLPVSPRSRSLKGGYPWSHPDKTDFDSVMTRAGERTAR